MGLRRSSPPKDKTLVAVIVGVVLYCFLVFSEEDPEMGPEELEKFRADLVDWVVDNEEMLREEQNIMRERVRGVCRKYGIQQGGEGQPRAAGQLELSEEEWGYLKRVNWQYIYWAKPQDLVWCKVPKAGSSTWTYNFLKLAGHNTNSTKIHKLLRDYFPKIENNKLLKDTFKFMVVRHPFERLLSAYRDKLEDLSRDLEARNGFYYTMYGKHIVQEYRVKKIKKFNHTVPIEPTWREFITYILNTPSTKFDEHWTPIWMLCSPCNIRYNVISKMERFSEDTQYTLHAGGLEDVLEVEWKHRTGTGGSYSTIMEYYSELTISEVAALFKKYQLDFEFYGYSPEPFFDIARDDEENALDVEQ